MKTYDHKKIEKKWQAFWAKKKIYEADDKSSKKKFYPLVEFPFPSGAGLHTGHIRSYTAMDIIARKHRMMGENVLYPMGWDAFGLPTENYALKTGTSPKVATKQNTDNFRRQLKSLGFSFDWTREINTTDPAYYKWTQWIFLQMYKKGLAYKAKIEINWCPKDKIGLANEEVVNGKCDRCGTPVEKRLKEQWMLAITKYADRLYSDLDTVDYLSRIKIQQRNWIGKSEGAEIDFPIKKNSNFVLIHGFKGSPKKDFFPWLKSELERMGHKVEVPALPNPDDPTVSDQMDYVLKNCHFDENTVVLGHSLGATVAMKVLEKLKKPIDKLVLAAGFIENNFVEGIVTFEDYVFDWKYDFENIRSKTKSVLVLKDINDPFVLGDQAEKIQSKLGGEVFSFAALGEHITAAEEPYLLSKIVPMISVFTTRPDTLFGVTYLVIAPEHPLVESLSYENKDEVGKYVKEAKNKNEIERTDAKKEKTGVELKGVKVVNPVNGDIVPVFVADYVLAGYGTGAVMAVPAHDERDFEFAKKYKLPIRIVVEPKFVGTEGDGAVKPGLDFVKRNAICAIVRNPKDDSYMCVSWKGIHMHGLVTGGIEDGEDIVESAKREILEETGYKNLKFVKVSPMAINTFFYHRVKKQNRHAHFQFVFFDLENEEKEKVDEKEAALHEIIWKKKADFKSFFTVFEGEFLIELLEKDEFAFIGNGILVDSGKFSGRDSEAVMKEITEFAGGKWVTKYKLKDWVFSRQRYWGEPIPMVNCEKCGWIPVPEKELPVKLPEVKKYAPTDTGESPLAGISKWVNVKCPECGGKAKRETDTMPNWAGSSWYYLRYIDPQNKKIFADKEKLERFMPVDWYNGGMEHTTLHLLYSRFWHKFLFDQGFVNTSEPYQKRTSHGMILASDGEKMSKSKGNLVSPDELVSTYGADTLRLHEMFMGPFDQSVIWNTESIIGLRRFIERVWKLQERISAETPSRRPAELAKSDGSSNSPRPREGVSAPITQLLNKTIKKVTEDIEAMNFNTAISSLMVLANAFEKEATISKEDFEAFTKLLAPFVPHIAEEIWSSFGNKQSIHISDWPKYDDKFIKDEKVKIAVQVNGKTRAVVLIAADAEEGAAFAAAKAAPEMQKWLSGKIPSKIIYVKGKIINLIVQD